MKLKLSSAGDCSLNELQGLWSALTYQLNDYQNQDVTNVQNKEKQSYDIISNELDSKEHLWEFVAPLYLDASQDKEVKYLLFYRNPIVGLSLAINQGLLISDYINNWLGSARCLIGFQKLNRENSLLIDYDAFLEYPHEILKYLNKIGIEASAECFSGIDLPSNTVINDSGFLAGSILVGQHRELKQTLSELQASSVLFREWSKPSLNQAFSSIEQYQKMISQFNSHEQLVQELLTQVEKQSNAIQLLEAESNETRVRLTKTQNVSEQLLIENKENEQVLLSLKEKELEAHELKIALTETQREKSSVQSENELLLLQLHQVQEELEQTFIQKKQGEGESKKMSDLIETQEKQLETLNKENAALKQNSEKQTHQSHEFESENELLLLQLHQVQEELEQTFIQKKQGEGESESKKMSDLIETQEKQLETLNKENAALKQNSEKQTHQSHEFESENELLLLQLHQVQEELEQTFIQKKQGEGESESKKMSDLIETQEKQLETLNKENAALKQNSEKQTHQSHEFESENELLLLQLHQVQEELEHYFSENQKLQDSIKIENEQQNSTIRKLKATVVTRTDNKAKRKINKNDLKALFHRSWYQKQVGKVFRPFSHYLSNGKKNQFSPHPLFDAKYYIEHNQLENLKENPLTHFLTIGVEHGLSPHPLFDLEWYIKINPDIHESDKNPLVHYLKFGGFEDRDPSPKFSSKDYLEKYPDVGQSKMNPLMHYIVFGQNEDRVIFPSRFR